jgi:uncharacterized integral membrane protein (TIGR00698 family)
MAQSLVLIAVVLAFWGVLSAPAALAVGMVLALANLAAYQSQAKKLSKQFIQASIVLLGFSIPLADVARAGLSGLALSTGAIVLVFAAAAVLARVLRVQDKMAALLASGTAICGGSAIAATSGVIGAAAAETAVATAVIFLLNAVGVYVYPVIGHALNMTDAQFGSWAAIGVHDVAGVVAAGKAFSDAAADQATIIKLTRVLWIVPVAFALAWWVRRSEAAAAAASPAGADATGAAATKAKTPSAPIPWFILWFLVACALRSFVPLISTTIQPLQDVVTNVREAAPWLAPRWLADAASGAGGISAATLLRGIGKALLTVALLLIGLGLSRQALRQAGGRALAMGVILWLIVSVASLLVVRML